MATNSAISESIPVPLGRVLVVDDDPTMRDLIVTFLRRFGGEAVGIGEADRVMQSIDSGSFSLVVLDVQLGAVDGFDVLRRIRERSDIPVILITGEREHEIDRVLGLELGADDYLTKPFSLRELLARLRSTLRRQEAGRASQRSPAERGGFRFNGWELRRRTRSLVDPAGIAVPLTKGEYSLLLAFLQKPNRILTRAQLLHATRTQDDVFDRSIDVQILRLRRKLELDAANPELIRTERGVGYRLDTVVERFF